MFDHFKKLWGNDSGDDEPKSPPVSPPPIDADQLEQLRTDDREAAELDAIYRQALDAFEMVETGVQAVADEIPDDDPPAAPSVAESASNEEFTEERPPEAPSVTPTSILEAALFVGGVDLTLKRLCQLLRDEFPPERVEEFLDELNARYLAEGRPYEVRFGEGGYRLALRAEYEDVRNRVFGLGPREFKLSQEALEVLSLVAYEQPIESDRIIELRGDDSSTLLRQLLRRQLVMLERRDEETKEVVYRTTPRFLEAFGLTDISDLPQADDLAFK